MSEPNCPRVFFSENDNKKKIVKAEKKVNFIWICQLKRINTPKYINIHNQRA